MTTFHPSTIKRTDGWHKAMVIMRNPAGQCIGSRTTAHCFATAREAREYARDAAVRTVRRLARDFPRFNAQVA